MVKKSQAPALPQWAITLKALRKKHGETQKQFGERFGVTSQTVSYWEGAVYEPPARVLTWVLVDGGVIDVGEKTEWQE